MLERGDRAPEFEGLAESDDRVSLLSLRGQVVILYFYPRDDTPGCTKEACGFRDELSKYKRAGAVVIGVSRDSLESHEKFVKKYNLNFTLASDKDSDVCEKYDVWRMKNNYCKTYLTFVDNCLIVNVNKIN